ncbi:MAG: HisA/HisF-related TIM barrel protein [Anaerolineae bacterium]|jgi:dihydroorotate dehydrogenase (NAD+) catalytic subunit
MSGIELAPHHKTGLTLRSPVMPAAGCFGLGGEYQDLVDGDALGAVVVGPVTARPCPGAAPPRALPVPGGVLLNTGLANPGINAVIQRYADFWRRLSVPTIVHVAGTRPDEVESCCRSLAGIDNVCGIELGLPPDVTGDEASDLVQSAARAAYQPLLVRLPLRNAHLLCATAVEAGAHALTIAAPPQGTAWDVRGKCFITGGLYGPLVLPLALHALQRVAERVTVPLIGCGGVHSTQDARAFLNAGAAAIQVGSALWRDPACLARIAANLASSDLPH